MMKKGRKKREQHENFVQWIPERGEGRRNLPLLAKRKDSCILRLLAVRTLDDTSELRFLNTWRKKSEKYYMCNSRCVLDWCYLLCIHYSNLVVTINIVTIKHLIISLLKCIIFGMHFRFISSLKSVTEYYYYL